jgi:Cytochrome c7 and related cytochrome c
VRWVVPLLAAGILWSADAPEQPIPFSHKQHVGTAKLQCKICHPNPDPGESMTIAPASVCMQCHSAIKADSPPIQKLAQFAKDGGKVPWVRVYQIPSYVNYSHRTHLGAKAQCSDCHANVAESEKVAKEGNISMGACITCHQTRGAGIDCNFCHEPR